MLFTLNYDYHDKVLYKKNINFWSKSKEVVKLTAKLKLLMAVCNKNRYHI